jgi:hypothetical protein
MKRSQPHASSASSGASRLDASSIVSWEHNPQSQALRVETQDGAFLVLPYSHFAFAHFARETDREILHVSFTTHDVHVFGRNLRELGLGLQKLAVEWIRAIPTRYVALSEEGSPFIERIEVTEVAGSIDQELHRVGCSASGN